MENKAMTSVDFSDTERSILSDLGLTVGKQQTDLFPHDLEAECEKRELSEVEMNEFMVKVGQAGMYDPEFYRLS